MCGTVSSIMSCLETRSLGQHIRHNVISSLVTVCPSRSSVHRFLGLTSTKQRVHATCSRPQRNVHRRGIEPGTPWSEIRRPIHCATPPHEHDCCVHVLFDWQKKCCLCMVCHGRLESLYHLHPFIYLISWSNF